MRSTLFAALSVVLLVALLVVLCAGPMHAQVAVPFTQNGLTLSSLSSEVSYTVLLSSLPERPELTATAVPQASHADMSLQVEISGCTLVNSIDYCTTPRVTSPGTGPRSVRYEPWRCVVGTTYPAYVGHTCNVKVRALGFGSAGAPAQFDLTLRSTTVVPTTTISSTITTNPVQTLTLSPSKDTTIYQASTSASNGWGESFWAAAGTGANELRALFDFNVAAAIPEGAIIVDARLELDVLSLSGAPQVSLFAIPRSFGLPWFQGFANASGDESLPTSSSDLSATWSHRKWAFFFPDDPWSSPGGDFELPALAAGRVNSVGSFVMTSPGLVDHVTLLASGSGSHDGLLLLATTGSARFASSENPTPSRYPRLSIDYAMPPDPISSNLPTSTASFFNENQDFRWIYDLDHDDILITPVLGRCQVTETFGNILPYTYQFLGSPTFAGVDCCTWQVDSTTGISGSGQALFFINVDGGNPANQPLDVDLDGIRDLCDNCPSVPNGPLLGSCVAGSQVGNLCRSNQECDGGLCSFAQDDQDLDGEGNACVPEPGFPSGLVAGAIALLALARRRTTVMRRI